MKYLSLLIILCLVGSGIGYGANLEDGFLDIQWGTSVSSLFNFSKVRENGNVSYYINPNRVHVINNVEISHVVYGFYLDRFFAVYVRIDNIKIFAEVKKYMTTKYGNPSITMSMKNEQTVYRWKHKETKMKLKYYEKDAIMKLAFYYTPISNNVNEEDEEKYYEKSFRFFPIDKNKKPETLPSIPLLQF